MPCDFPPLVAHRKNGSEKFRFRGADAGFDLRGFWQWSVSDLVSNATRGRLAEYIVAKALGIADGVRNEWDAFDLLTTTGIKVEVKSAAYIQSWYQKKLSPIAFVIPPTREWDATTNKLTDEVKRQAEVYVFAILSHQDKNTVDPMDLDQWEFYVLPVSALNDRRRSQYSITLTSLRSLCSASIRFSSLADAIIRAGEHVKEATKTPLESPAT